MKMSGNAQITPRGGHTMTVVSHYGITFGGSDSKSAFNDIWALDLGKLIIVLHYFQIKIL